MVYKGLLILNKKIKSLYGLKRSSRKWHKRSDSYMIQIGYTRCEYDGCVYVKSLDYGLLSALWIVVTYDEGASIFVALIPSTP